MSTGTGIFLASIVIALVLLYLKTRDEWQWSSIPRIILKHKKIVMQLMAFSAIVVFLIFLSKWTQAYIKKTEAIEVREKINEERFKELQSIENKKIQIKEQEIAEKKAREKQFEEKLANEKARLESQGEFMPHQIDYNGFSIGMTKKDLVYMHGNGNRITMDEPYDGSLIHTFWFNTGEHYRYYSESHIYVRVNQDKIDALAIGVNRYEKNEQYERVCSNCGKNRKTPKNINDLKEKFGQPSKEIHSDDDRVRTYYFDDYGIAAVLSADVIEIVVIYDPASTKR